MSPDDEVENLLASLPESIRDRFSKLERIGHGQTGIVYKGWDKMLKRHFALKVLNPDHVTDERILRLQREAKTLCQLQHPNIVSVYDFIVTGNSKPILVMELLDGQSLESLIDENGPLSIDENLDIVLQICSAIEYAHEHGVLHRDLSANNILVCKNTSGLFQIKVIDFGISKVESVHDRTIVKSGALVGSVTVISPEQARGQKIDSRSDIYSLGCLMYKVFSGTYPYRGKTLLEIVAKHINEEIPSIPDQYPESLNDAITKAMQKLPEDRFQKIGQMREAIENIDRLDAEQEPAFTALARKTTFPNVPAKSVKKNAYLPIFIGASIALVPLSALVFSIFNQNTKLSDTDESQKSPSLDVRITFKNDQQWLSATDPRRTTFPKSLFSVLDTNPDVRRVALTNVRISNEQLDKLSQYNLEILDLKNCPINDRSLEIISKCRSLRSLLLRGCRNITDFGMSSLFPLDKLIIISIADTRISSKGLIPLLKENKNLKAVHANNCTGVNEACIPHILASPKLDSLRLTATGIGRSGARTLLTSAHQVGYLGLGSLNLEDSDIPLQPPHKLSRLEVRNNTKLTEIAFKRLLSWKQLNFLNIENCELIPNKMVEETEEDYKNNHLIIAPSIFFDWEKDDTEAYYEPTLYDRSSSDQSTIKQLLVRWGSSGKDAPDK